MLAALGTNASSSPLARRARRRAIHPVAAALALLALALPSMSPAREYAVDVFAADENELRQLYYDGLLDEEELAILLFLLESPVDLNSAGSQDLYQLPGVSAALAAAIAEERELSGPFVLPADLIQRVEGVTPRLWESIEPFVLLRFAGKARAKGNLRFLAFKRFRGSEPLDSTDPGRSRTAAQLGYANWPAMALSAGLSVSDWLDVGLGGFVQEGLKTAQYDPASRDIVGSWGAPLFRPYLAYVRIERPSPRGEVIAGHYHAHFGHGLVLSTMSGRDRHGFFVRQSALRGEDRLRPFDGLLGIAGRVQRVPLGKANLDLSGFFSARPYDVYGSYLAVGDGAPVDLGGVAEDPAAAEDPDFDSPRLWVDGQRLQHQTVPNAVGTILGGGDATVRVNRRTFVGLTGYGAFLNRRAIAGTTGPYDILYRKRWPSRQGFGSVGVHGAVGVGILDLSGEAALWFEAGEPEVALYFVGELEPIWGEFVWSVRHYDKGYGNPYTRSESASDQVHGLRSRNEDGVRLQFTAEPVKQLRVRLVGDLSRNIAYDLHDLRLDASVRGDPLPFLRLTGQIRFTNQNLAVNGRSHRYGQDLDYDAIQGYLLPPSLFDEEQPSYLNRAGERLTWTASAALWDDKIGRIELRYGQSLTDNRKLHERGNSCQWGFQVGHRVRAVGRVRPHPSTTIKAGAVYSDDDLSGSRSVGSENGAHAAEGYVQLDQKIKDKVSVQLRGGVGRRLPNRPSACDEVPSSQREAGVEPAALVEYVPTAWETRFFGEFLASVGVRF